MRLGQATGFQVVFLMFAVMLLAVPLTGAIVKAVAIESQWHGLLNQATQFGLAIVTILAFPHLRRFALQQVALPIPAARRLETFLVALAKLTLAFAAPAALALWVWGHEGWSAVSALHSDPEVEAQRATSGRELARLALAVLVAPIVEEIVCRGFIYRAFERQWGWLASTILTSTVFGFYHTHFWAAFTASVVYVCLYRRTGTLRAPILAHMLFNLMLWHPLLGQYVFPSADKAGDPRSWTIHITCLAFVAVALPIYIWMSRERNVAQRTVFLEPDGALQK